MAINIDGAAVAFGTTTTLFATGVTFVASNVNQCLHSPDGWALFLSSDVDKAAMTVVIAGLLLFVFKLTGYKPGNPYPEKEESPNE